MKFSAIALAISVAVCLVCTGEARGGARASVSQKLIDYAVSTFVPVLEKKLSSLSFPDISGSKDSIEYSVHGIHVTGFGISSPKVSFVAGQGISLDWSGISVSAHMDWSYKEKIWPHEPRGSGSADASAGGSSVKGLMKLSVVNGKPHVEASDLSVQINDFSIKTHGSLLSWLYNLIVKSFKGSIKSAVAKAIKDAVGEEVNTDLNKILSTLAMTQALPLPAPYNVALVDYTILNLDVEADHIAIDIRGSINDTSKSAAPYSGAVPAMPPASASVYGAHHVVIDLSSFLFESAAYVFANRGLLQYTITSKDIPASAPIKLNTDTFVALAPGLKKWPAAPMSITAGVRSTPSFTFASGKVGINLAADFNFSVVPKNGTAVDAFGLVCNLEASATPSITAQTLHFTISPNATCTPKIAYSHIGTVDASGFGMILNLAIAAIVPIANKIIASGVPLPSVEGFSFANTAITADNNLLSLTTDIKYGK